MSELDKIMMGIIRMGNRKQEFNFTTLWGVAKKWGNSIEAKVQITMAQGKR